MRRWAMGGIVLAAAAALSGCGQPMMGMMGGMHGSRGRGETGSSAARDERLTAALGGQSEWIDLALAHARELALSADQEKALTSVRDAWRADAAGLTRDIQARESELRQLFGQPAVDLPAARAKIKRVAELEGDLRFRRVEAIEKATAALTPAQRQELTAIVRSHGGPAASGGAAPPSHGAEGQH